MKANELRIGNYILHEPTIDDWEEIIVTLPSLLQVDISPESYCGIPLTEEWLLKFGFTEAIVYGQKQYDIHNFTIYIEGGDFMFSANILGRPLFVKHAHQLQNLYFALTGEELELKEKQDA